MRGWPRPALLKNPNESSTNRSTPGGGQPRTLLMDPHQLRIQDFYYPLPAGRIAPEPLADRAASRLLVSRQGVISDKTFRDLPDELPADSLLIFNNTRVVRARLLARRPTGGAVELSAWSRWPRTAPWNRPCSKPGPPPGGAWWAMAAAGKAAR
ncbi:MAG: S-adenosylmethionine:tRNA ribosyltransferase-isomerase [Hymenobacter sp.]